MQTIVAVLCLLIFAYVGADSIVSMSCRQEPHVNHDFDTVRAETRVVFTEATDRIEFHWNIVADGWQYRTLQQWSYEVYFNNFSQTRLTSKVRYSWAPAPEETSGWFQTTSSETLPIRWSQVRYIRAVLYGGDHAKDHVFCVKMAHS